MAQQWLTTAVLMAFAILSLVVATVGVYGVVAYGVTQRAREFGVRMPLGAARSQVLMMVLGRTVRLVLIGTAVGTAAALAASRGLRTILNVAPTDWVSYCVAIGVLAT